MSRVLGQILGPNTSDTARQRIYHFVLYVISVIRHYSWYDVVILGRENLMPRQYRRVSNILLSRLQYNMAHTKHILQATRYRPARPWGDLHKWWPTYNLSRLPF